MRALGCMLLLLAGCSRSAADTPPPAASGQLAPIAPGATGARAAGRVAAPEAGTVESDPEEPADDEEEPAPLILPPSEDAAGVPL
ncbi:MAG: hypothetical protein KF718_18805 [Polyangiaceae bacterium]|nr:hypothetical protein [Polyangiaceae bacterium]